MSSLAILIVPELGTSKSPRSDSKVDLPEPEGPIIATFSPGFTAKETFSKIDNLPSPTLKSFPTPLTSKI
jgi:hypothetical protein